MIPLLTIITPVHNMAGKLGNLRTWLKEATVTQAEIILVDDLFSEFTSGELEQICREYPESQLKVIKGNFKSPGESRNAAIAKANGEWVVFWDSDDIGHPAEVVDALNKVSRSTDLTVFAFEICDWKDRTLSTRIPVLSSWQNLIEITNMPGLWRIAVRRTFLADIRFPHLLMAEDQVLLSRLSSKTPRLTFVDVVAYSYFKNVPDQLTSKKTPLLNIEEALRISRDELQVTPKNIANLDLYLRQCLSAVKFGNIHLKMNAVWHLLAFFSNGPLLTKTKLIKRILNG